MGLRVPTDTAARRVHIICGDEKRPREHKFVRPEPVESAGGIQYWKLVFACCICEAERVFGNWTL